MEFKEFQKINKTTMYREEFKHKLDKIHQFELQALREHPATQKHTKQLEDLELIVEKKKFIALNDQLEETELWNSVNPNMNPKSWNQESRTSAATKQRRLLAKQLETTQLWKDWKLQKQLFSELQKKGNRIMTRRNKLAKEWALWKCSLGEPTSRLWGATEIERIDEQLENIALSVFTNEGGAAIDKLISKKNELLERQNSNAGRTEGHRGGTGVPDVLKLTVPC